jgi:hypothetical protein
MVTAPVRDAGVHLGDLESGLGEERQLWSAML